MNIIRIATLAMVVVVPFAAHAQDAAPAKSERAMPDSNNKAGMKTKTKSERAMTSKAKTEKATPGSERAMPEKK